MEVLEDGPRASRFHVDFTPLADISGNDSYRVCLVETFERYKDAVAAEVAWLESNYVLGATHGETRPE